MSNQVSIIPTRFENLRTGEVDYGFRVFDEYNQGYELLYDAKPPDDDLQCLRLCLESEDNSIREILDWVEENRSSVTIGETEYSWGEIKSCFED